MWERELNSGNSTRHQAARGMHPRRRCNQGEFTSVWSVPWIGTQQQPTPKDLDHTVIWRRDGMWKKHEGEKITITVRGYIGTRFSLVETWYCEGSTTVVVNADNPVTDVTVTLNCRYFLTDIVDKVFQDSEKEAEEANPASSSTEP